MIALHPVMQEVTAEETRPSVQTCNNLLDSLQQICLRHGEEVSYYKLLFQTIESVIVQIENDDMPVYLRFLKDVAVGSVSDRALLLSSTLYLMFLVRQRRNDILVPKYKFLFQ